MIRPESVRKYGHNLLSMLNQGRLNPALLRGAAAPVTGPTPKRSFATGGAVMAQPGGSGGSEATIVRTLQFHDEQTMDRALAAGPESMLRFVRRQRAGFRAALNS